MCGSPTIPTTLLHYIHLYDHQRPSVLLSLWTLVTLRLDFTQPSHQSAALAIKCVHQSKFLIHLLSISIAALVGYIYGSPTVPTTDNNRCYNPGCRLLGNFREGSRKVQKIGVGRYQQFRPVNLTPAILYDTFQIIIIDVGCLTNNRRYNSGCQLL